MSDDDKKERSNKRIKKILFFCAGILLLSSALLAVSLKIYLSSPSAASRLSSLLSSYLQQPVTVNALHTSGAALYLKGFSIADSPGVSGGSLLTAESITIAPHWSRLLLGRRDFRLIELERVQIDLRQNAAGIWNFSGLSRLFAKPSAEETFIRHLSIRNGSLKVNGRGVSDISFKIHDLAAKGFQDSRIELTFQDGAQNRYTLNGTGRTGNDAAFDLTLRASAISLDPLTRLLKLQNSAYLKLAHGDLLLAATLHKGQLLAHGELGFKHIAATGRMPPVSGRLLFNGSYQLESDQARLKGLDLIVGDLLRLHGTGTVNGLKKERIFELDLKMDDVDLQRLAAFLPPEKSWQMAFSGRLGTTALHLAGSANQGITAITGGARLGGVSLTQAGRLWISGLCSTINVEKQTAGIAVKGDLSNCGSGTQAALESIQAAFVLALSPRLKLQKAVLSPLHARFMGLALDGRASYDIAAAEPFNASLQSSSGDLATVNPLLKPFGLQLDAGTGSLTAQAGGKGPHDFNAAAELKVSGLHGRWGHSKLSLKQGIAMARGSRHTGQLAVSGTGELNGLAAAGKNGQARLTYRLANNLLTLENSSINWDGSTINITHLTAFVPSGEKRQGAVYYPLAIGINGVDVKHKAADARGISGRLAGYLVRDGKSSWLEGTAELSGGQLRWQGKPVAGPLARLTFDRSGAQAGITGTLLGGGLRGEVAFNPFAVAEGATFGMVVKGADLSSTAGLLPPHSGAAITEGFFDGSMKGSYSGTAGLIGGVEVTGKGVTVTGSGKTLLSRAGISLSGTIAGQKVTLRKALVTAGKGVSLTADGEVENAFSDARQGSFNFAMPQAPLNSYIDAFVNIMPRFLQEATLDGSLDAQGTLALQNGHRLLQGALRFRKISLDSPRQTITMSELDGSLPFSLDLSGSTTAAISKSDDFSRDNFKLLLQRLNREPKEGQVVTIGRIALGQLELGALTMRVQAAKGLTEILTLKSTFHGGTLLGTGSLVMKKGAHYRGDLLINGLSLTELCSRFPAIKGYLSGRVNGIVSVYGEGSGVSGQYGFTELWANEAKGEKMLVSREFLQRLGSRKLSGIFFRQDLPYDRAEISALLEQGYLTFDTLDIVHSNLFGVRDLNVSIAPAQNMIALDHLIESIKQASASGKAATDKGDSPGGAAPTTEFKWQE